jgi:hypothetical protein
MEMITFIVAFITSHIVTIGSLAVAAGSIVFGMFRHQQAKTAIAQAASTVATKQSQDDQANAAASQRGEQAVINRSTADAEAAATPRDEIDAQLAAIGAQRKE